METSTATARPANKYNKRHQSKRKPNFNARYGKLAVYIKICAQAHRTTKQTCCLCLKNSSEEIHHSYYIKPGITKAGLNGFPLCKPCHDIAHLPKNYMVCSRSHWNNKNTPEFHDRLVLGYNLLNISTSSGKQR
jgi:hypothetical protein